jgi:hypothetical protein
MSWGKSLAGLVIVGAIAFVILNSTGTTVNGLIQRGVPRPIDVDPQLRVLTGGKLDLDTLSYTIHKNPHVQRALSAPELEWLLRQLSSKNAWDRKGAAALLGCGGASAARAVPQLIPLLGDPDREAQGEAARALLRLAPGDAAVKQAIVKVSADRAWQDRCNLAYYLVRYAPDAVEYIGALNDLRDDQKHCVEFALQERAGAKASPAGGAPVR